MSVIHSKCPKSYQVCGKMAPHFAYYKENNHYSPYPLTHK